VTCERWQSSATTRPNKRPLRGQVTPALFIGVSGGSTAPVHVHARYWSNRQLWRIRRPGPARQTVWFFSAARTGVISQIISDGVMGIMRAVVVGIVPPATWMGAWKPKRQEKLASRREQENLPLHVRGGHRDGNGPYGLGSVDDGALGYGGSRPSRKEMWTPITCSPINSIFRQRGIDRPWWHSTW
jgi:hypothetical protein